MNGQRSRSDAPAVIFRLVSLRETPGARLVFRILEMRRVDRRLDIRQFLVSDGFQGFTRKGVCLTAEEFDALLEQRDRIRAALEGGQASAGGRAGRVQASP